MVTRKNPPALPRLWVVAAMVTPPSFAYEVGRDRVKGRDGKLGPYARLLRLAYHREVVAFRATYPGNTPAEVPDVLAIYAERKVAAFLEERPARLQLRAAARAALPDLPGDPP